MGAKALAAVDRTDPWFTPPGGGKAVALAEGRALGSDVTARVNAHGWPFDGNHYFARDCGNVAVCCIRHEIAPMFQNGQHFDATVPF